MLRAERTYRQISVAEADDSPVTGLVLAGLVVTAYARAYGAAAAAMATYDASPALVELGGGAYELAFLAPPLAGWYCVTARPVTTTRSLWNARWEGECEANDLDSVMISISAGGVAPPANLLLGWSYPGQLVAARYNRWSLPIVDANGAAVDLSTYGALRLSVRSIDQTTRKLDAQHGSPAGFVLLGTPGLLTLEWPESTGAGIADIYAHLATGDLIAATPLYYEVTGDVAGDPAKTVPIIRSSALIISRREVGT